MVDLGKAFKAHKGKACAGLLGASLLLGGCATPAGDQSYERGYPDRPNPITGGVTEATGVSREEARAGAVNAGRIYNGIRILEAILD